uniref:Uncharacterized protein n=1 Tax=Zea mays TaxID=4577 RepID=C0HGD5_MAIZE|nr:unknown [Zea mays]
MFVTKIMELSVQSFTCHCRAILQTVLGIKVHLYRRCCVDKALWPSRCPTKTMNNNEMDNTFSLDLTSTSDGCCFAMAWSCKFSFIWS